jgi:hypothetical protein
MRRPVCCTRKNSFLGDILTMQAGLAWDKAVATLSAEATRIPVPQLERRDVELAIQHWQQNAWGRDCIPFLDAFDFSPMRANWGQRFLVYGSSAVEDAVFVTYGPGFAGILGLPLEPVTTTPFTRQLPEAYREMFSEGYSEAMIESSPVTLEGTIRFGAAAQLFRAVFMPIMVQPNWSKQLIFGSFNHRPVRAV